MSAATTVLSMLLLLVLLLAAAHALLKLSSGPAVCMLQPKRLSSYSRYIVSFEILCQTRGAERAVVQRGVALRQERRESMHARKRAARSCSLEPLSHPGILQHVLDYVGPGCFLFAALVAKAWWYSYARVPGCQLVGIDSFGNIANVQIVPQTTLSSAAFASPTCVKLASDCLLRLDTGTPNLHRIAGRYADTATLRTVQSLGLKLTEDLARGAAVSGELQKLVFLAEQHCPFPADITMYAARCGVVEVLVYLQQQGCALTTRTASCAGKYSILTTSCSICYGYNTAVGSRSTSSQLPSKQQYNLPIARIFALYSHYSTHVLHSYPIYCGAAKAGHLNVLQYLRSQKCPIDVRSADAAASKAHMHVLRWLRDCAYPWSDESVSFQAAASGSLQLMQWLKEQGCVFSASTMAGAAAKGHTAVCQFLYAAGMCTTANPNG
jgi:hypothetical protein